MVPEGKVRGPPPAPPPTFLPENMQEWGYCQHRGSRRESCPGPSLVSCPVPAAAGKVGTWHKGLDRRVAGRQSRMEAWDPGAIVLFQRGGGAGQRRKCWEQLLTQQTVHTTGQRVQRQNQGDGQKKRYTEKGNFKTQYQSQEKNSESCPGRWAEPLRICQHMTFLRMEIPMGLSISLGKCQGSLGINSLATSYLNPSPLPV